MLEFINTNYLSKYHCSIQNLGSLRAIGTQKNGDWNSNNQPSYRYKLLTSFDAIVYQKKTITILFRPEIAYRFNLKFLNMNELKSSLVGLLRFQFRCFLKNAVFSLKSMCYCILCYLH